jgi:hypothetical protein
MPALRYYGKRYLAVLSNPAREGLWNPLLVKHGMRLLNPSSLGAVAHRVALLCYGKDVEVKRGDTLHSCTPGKSIDLTAASWGLNESALKKRLSLLSSALQRLLPQ